MASHTRLVMNIVIRTYLRSLTQIENVSTKREQFVVISLTIAFPLKGYPLCILKIERMTTSNENG